MKKFILAVILVFCANVFAQNTNTCSSTTFPASGGGVTVWPWSLAKPFPWTSIQGVWTAVGADKSNLVFEFKVTRSTDKIKQLFVEIYNREDCKKAYMRGVGVVNADQKNVVRVNMNNVLMKLAMFNTADLEMDANSCGTKTLGATFYRLTEPEDSFYENSSGSTNASQSSNIVLKKVSNANLNRCKK